MVNKNWEGVEEKIVANARVDKMANMVYSDSMSPFAI